MSDEAYKLACSFDPDYIGCSRKHSVINALQRAIVIKDALQIIYGSRGNAASIRSFADDELRKADKLLSRRIAEFEDFYEDEHTQGVQPDRTTGESQVAGGD